MSSTKLEVHTYRNDAAGKPSHGHRQHAQKLVKIARAVPDISSQTDRQTDTHIRTHHNTSQQRNNGKHESEVLRGHYRYDNGDS